MRKGRALPQWYLEEPPEEPLDGFYINSFWALNTTRKFELGPIPWDIILKYALHRGMDSDLTENFIGIIRVMDFNYIEAVVEETDRNRRQQSPKTNRRSK